MNSRHYIPLFTFLAFVFFDNISIADNSHTPSVTSSAEKANPIKTEIPMASHSFEHYYSFGPPVGKYAAPRFHRIRSYNPKTAMSASNCAPHSLGCFHKKCKSKWKYNLFHWKDWSK